MYDYDLIILEECVATSSGMLKARATTTLQKN